MRKQPIKLLHWTVGALFLIHGIYRVTAGIVDDFGVFFTALGWPFGLALAWTITCMEIICALALLIGLWWRIASLYLVGQTLAGMILVHWPHGWFVVGAGRNGMEYSFLLIICLITIIWQNEAE